MGKLIPPGFLTVEATPCRLYCAIVREDCGATVPIYRHFKMVGPRVYYAYSTSSDIEIGANFTREAMPMCYGWSAQRPIAANGNYTSLLETTKKVVPLKEESIKKPLLKGEEAAIERLLKNSVTDNKSAEEEEEEAAQANDQKAGKARNGIADEDECSLNALDEAFPAVVENANNDTLPDAMESLHEGILVGGFALLSAYDNQKLGTLRDHLYTTRKQPAENVEYKKEKDLGLVLVDPSQSNCSSQCLMKMGQMLANRSDGLGIFPMHDHKLVLMGKESADTYYQPTGEVFYCARRMGQCGARLALRRYWHLVEMDTLLTVNTSSPSAVPVFSIPTWDGVLCYIWEMPNGN